LKTQIPMLALTRRLSWAMVKPTPVPTRETKPRERVCQRRIEAQPPTPRLLP
jgi:hypothetical protein